MAGKPWTDEQRAKYQAKIAARKAKKIAVASEAETERLGQPLVDNTAVMAEAIARAALEVKSKQEMARDENLVEAMAESHRRLTKPENPVSPQVSAFNPEGERDHPTPALKCQKVFQCGRPTGKKMGSTKEEILLINELITVIQKARNEHRSIGPFMVSKADGTQAKVTIETKWNDVSNQLEELHIGYPVSTPDMRSGYYSFQMMLSEMLGKAQPDVDVPAIQARMRALETENAALRAG